MDKYNGGRTSIDDFWDLASLVPSRAAKKQAQGTFSPPVTPKTVTNPASNESAGEARPEAERRLSGAGGGPVQSGACVLEYQPRGNCLIEFVRVCAHGDRYSFYGRFRRDAERFLEVEGKPCPFVKYFSYLPQYAQLNAAQLSYYLYWRSCVRRGEYPETDESYFYLYVYEIINLPDKIPPDTGVHLLARVWGAYRKAFSRIDQYMAEVLCDYCLVHALPCPQEDIRRFRAKILPHASLREFYLGEIGEMSEGGTDSALAFFSDYRFRDSRYAQGENAALFEREIIAAITPVLRAFLARSEKALATATVTHKTREAFSGSLCAQQVRSTILVRYRAIADVLPLRELLTNAVKYAENRLRMYLSVKSRLSVRALAPEYREMIDAYFDAKMPKKVKGKGQGDDEIEAVRPHLLPEDFAVDASLAAAIEKASWATTKLLVFEEEEEKDAEVIEPSAVPATPSVCETREYFAADADSSKNGGASLSQQARGYLALLLAGDAASARRYASECGRMEEELAEEINEKSMEEIGDIALEIGEDGYSVVPDYLDEVATWTK